MKRFYPIVLATFLACSCSAGTTSYTEPAGSITIISYNVGVLNKYCADSAPLVAGLVKENEADLVGFCELDKCTVRSKGRDQLKELTGLLGKGWKGKFCSALHFGGGDYGVGVASRKKILRSFQIHLPKGDGSEPRVCQVIETPECFFAVTHLDYTQGTARDRQATQVSETLRKKCVGKPVILCGDFNAAPDSRTLELLGRNWEIVSSGAYTFPSREPRACIDYIMVLKGSCSYLVEKAEVISEGEAVRDASDHLPTLVRLSFVTSEGR